MHGKLVLHTKTRTSDRDRYDQMKIVANNKPVDARWGIRMLIHALEVDKNRVANKEQIEQDLIDLTTTWIKGR